MPSRDRKHARIHRGVQPHRQNKGGARERSKTDDCRRKRGRTRSGKAPPHVAHDTQNARNKGKTQSQSGAPPHTKKRRAQLRHRKKKRASRRDDKTSRNNPTQSKRHPKGQPRRLPQRPAPPCAAQHIPRRVGVTGSPVNDHGWSPPAAHAGHGRPPQAPAARATVTHRHPQRRHPVLPPLPDLGARPRSHCSRRCALLSAPHGGRRPLPETPPPPRRSARGCSWMGSSQAADDTCPSTSRSGAG